MGIVDKAVRRIGRNKLLNSDSTQYPKMLFGGNIDIYMFWKW